jgi:hypothetical protein
MDELKGRNAEISQKQFMERKKGKIRWGKIWEKQ